MEAKIENLLKEKGLCTFFKILTNPSQYQSEFFYLKAAYNFGYKVGSKQWNKVNIKLEVTTNLESRSPEEDTLITDVSSILAMYNNIYTTSLKRQKGNIVYDIYANTNNPEVLCNTIRHGLSDVPNGNFNVTFNVG